MAFLVLDPTAETSPGSRPRVIRPPSLDGRTVALLDITKARGDIFLDRLAVLLQDRGALVRRYSKPTFTKPAPLDLRQEIATQCEVVIEALAD